MFTSLLLSESINIQSEGGKKRCKATACRARLKSGEGNVRISSCKGAGAFVFAEQSRRKPSIMRLFLAQKIGADVIPQITKPKAASEQTTLTVV